ncbi:hypothetical protein C8F04DRAFT_1252793 [Mycena alexandri]|uniref:Protein kinase domain-containing protein n=1 Tax=Mycena alexandri TaxID=1745969 RepID=A0AAD6XBF5_9AGAR|nr:hypothetical protein C8F04DRAFT_1252793 [Mycena alexandri]
MTDSEPRSDEEYIHASALESPVFTSDGGGIFSGSQHFVIAGGTFTNITNYVTAPAIPSDIRMIPMGGHIPATAARIYSAKIDGRTPEMTVAVYRGDKAEEAWRRDIALYMSLRHPNILQIWGGASAGNVRATVFHGDLVPFQQFTARYDHSPIMTLYILAYYAGGRVGANFRKSEFRAIL